MGFTAQAQSRRVWRVLQHVADSRRDVISCEGVDAFWDALVAKTDGVVAMPYDRWDVDEYYDSNPAPGKMYVRHAAFVKGAVLVVAACTHMARCAQTCICTSLIQDGWRAPLDAY